MVSTASGNNGDSVLQLCDDFGRELAYNDDAPNGFSYDSEVTVRVFPGTYVIGVRQWGSGSPALVTPVRALGARTVNKTGPGHAPRAVWI